MINNIQDACHAFFYQEDTVFNKKRFSFSFERDRFFSYFTIIGKIVNGLNKKILLLSNDNFSHTTAMHISHLASACPFEIVRVPVKYGQHDITVDDAIDSVLSNLDFYQNQKLSQKKNRDAYVACFNMLIGIDEKVQKVKKSIIKKYEPLFDDLQNSESVKILKIKQAEKEKQQREKIKKKIAKYLKKYNIAELAQMVYDRHDHTLDGCDDLKASIKKYLNPKNELAFVWDAGDEFKTSKGVEMDKKDCELIINLFKNNKLKHGFQLCRYTVLEVTKTFVKIGCHKIPTSNIECLLAARVDSLTPPPQN